MWLFDCECDSFILVHWSSVNTFSVLGLCPPVKLVAQVMLVLFAGKDDRTMSILRQGQVLELLGHWQVLSSCLVIDLEMWLFLSSQIFMPPPGRTPSLHFELLHFWRSSVFEEHGWSGKR